MKTTASRTVFLPACSTRVSMSRQATVKRPMNEITDNGKLTQSSTGLSEDEMPNIMFVQLESFFDPTEVEWLRFSEDPIPNLRKLFDEYSSGYFKVPSVGAGTANTEFEVLTGMSMRFFGPGEYPYKTYAKC